MSFSASQYFFNPIDEQEQASPSSGPSAREKCISSGGHWTTSGTCIHILDGDTSGESDGPTVSIPDATNPTPQPSSPAPQTPVFSAPEDPNPTPLQDPHTPTVTSPGTPVGEIPYPDESPSFEGAPDEGGEPLPTAEARKVCEHLGGIWNNGHCYANNDESSQDPLNGDGPRNEPDAKGDEKKAISPALAALIGAAIFQLF